jgi:arabinogalactan endo-1,4-beta-galactosidase
MRRRDPAIPASTTAVRGGCPVARAVTFALMAAYAGGVVVGAGCGPRSQLLGTIGGAPPTINGATYFAGADITFVQADEAGGAVYSDGARKDIIQLLKDHGFNYIRLRTFVDPRAADGYDPVNGYGDLAHTIAFAQRVKAASMGFLLDFHLSDNWADPGKQCIPVAWQGKTLAQLAQTLHDYTRDAVTQLAAAGARPDMVQLGNEITPGLLIHVCDGNGAPTGTSAVNGSTSDWSNLGTLLKAAAAGVREVDDHIAIALHIDRGGDKATDRPGNALQTSIDWVDNAIHQGIPFDVLAESAYQVYQGDPNSDVNTRNGWANTFANLAARFPDLKLLAVEYASLPRDINDIVFGLPDQQGLGAFNWEPTREGTWNMRRALFSAAGNQYTSTTDLSAYDAMRTAYAGRL